MRGWSVAVVAIAVLARCAPTSHEGEREGEGEGEGDTECGAGETRCAGTCVDTASNAAHCGVCGFACGGGALCSDRRCASPCAAPSIDDVGETVGTFPELIGCDVYRYDADGDGTIDDTCGAFIVRTAPTFHLDPGPPAQSSDLGRRADLERTPGLEAIFGCQIDGSTLNIDPPCDLAGGGFADIDRDGDYDLVLADGRTYAQVDGLLEPGPPILAPPGPVAFARVAGALQLFARDTEAGTLVRADDDAWTVVADLPASPFADAESGRLFAVPGPTDDDESIAAWHGPALAPNVVRCDPEGAQFRCSSSAVASLLSLASPPIDGRVIDRFVAGRIGAQGEEIYAPIRDGVRIVAMDDASVWVVDAIGAVERHALVASAPLPLFTAVLRSDGPAIARSLGGTLEIDTDRFALPDASTIGAFAAVPDRPRVFVAATTLDGLTTVRMLDTDTGAVLLEIPNDGYLLDMQIVDVDADAVLELVLGSTPTEIRDLASGELRDTRAAYTRFVDVDDDGDLDETSLWLRGRGDLDGNGALDDETVSDLRVTIADDAFAIDAGRILRWWPGEAAHELVTFSEVAGTMTWPLRCE